MAILPDSTEQCLLAAVGALFCLLVFCPTPSESGAIGLSQNKTERAGSDKNAPEVATLEGKYYSKEDFIKRNDILREINETASSIEELEHLLEVVRAQQVKNRQRRDSRDHSAQECTFSLYLPTTQHGHCYYGFGDFVTCKAGNRLSFYAPDCPPERST